LLILANSTTNDKSPSHRACHTLALRDPLQNGQNAPSSNPIPATAPRKTSPDHVAFPPPHAARDSRLNLKPGACHRREPAAASRTAPHRTGAAERRGKEIFKSGGVRHRRAKSSSSDSFQRPALPPSPTHPARARRSSHLYHHRENSLLLRSDTPPDADPASYPPRGRGRRVADRR
jgi:hypothetical protein